MKTLKQTINSELEKLNVENKKQLSEQLNATRVLSSKYLPIQLASAHKHQRFLAFGTF